MKMGISLLATLSAIALMAPTVANAQAIITNGTIGLGVDAGGQLNIPGPASATGTDYYGLRDIGTNYEATADGCLCEGWGAAVQGTGNTVYANNDTGSNYSLVSFTSTANSATSVVTGSGLTVTHVFTPSSSNYLYQVDVTITNTSGADFTGSTLYRRVMDWDIEPTAFSEYSTIQGGAGASHVLFTSDDGFASSNPLSGPSSILGTGDFIDLGPYDHGALFDFIFDPLAAGQSQTLTIFYGAAPSERTALAALGEVGAEVYSFGQNSDDISGGNGITFIFGFKGVGGTPIPAGVPEPAAWGTMILGFGLAGGMMRRRRARTSVRFA